MHLILERLSDNGVQTLGKLRLCDSQHNILMQFDSLELPWRNNQRRVSCVPVGTYVVKRKYSFRFGWCYSLAFVKNRDGILIHKGNYHTNTLGCILIGNGLADINDDGEKDVLNSLTSMKNLLNCLKTTTTIKIVKSFSSNEL